MKIILIMGLPGSGKTTLASELAPLINAKRIKILWNKGFLKNELNMLSKMFTAISI